MNPKHMFTHVWNAYADLNGTEAADELPNRALEATAAYCTRNNLNPRDDEDKHDVLLALDVLRLAYDGEFRYTGNIDRTDRR